MNSGAIQHTFIIESVNSITKGGPRQSDRCDIAFRGGQHYRDATVWFWQVK